MPEQRVTTPFETRRAALIAELPQQNIDAMLLGVGANLRYVTGFTGSNAMLLLHGAGALLFTDPRYRLQAAGEVTCKVRVCTGPIPPKVLDAVRKLRIRRLGFERGRTTYDTYDHLRTNLPARTSLEPVSGWVERHRMVKSAEEIELIRASVAANSRAFDQAIRRLRPGMTERDFAAEIEYRMRRLGAERTAFDTLIASGPRSALVHAQAGAATIAAGSLILIDMGMMRDGYASDMTRMAFTGTPGPRVRRMYRAVLDAQLAALATVRPGVTAASVDRAARAVLKKHGLERWFVHSTGHGLGLEIHESPRLGRREKMRLEKGMTVTVEPGVYLEGFGGIRIEDTVVVTGGGCDVLTPTPKELLSV